MSASIRDRMTEPILYSFRRCPYAMRARMAILASGVTVELREVVLRDKPAEMIAISQKATVPVLHLSDGRVVDESLDIMRWALEQADPDDWLSGDDPALIAANDGPFKHALDRYKYPHRYGLQDGVAFRDEVMTALMALDQSLTTRPFLARDKPGLVDIALFPFFRQCAATDRAWFDAQALPALHRWLESLTAAPLFEAAMQRFPKWQADDPPTLFHQNKLFSH